jgi:hypothetical protein
MPANGAGRGVLWVWRSSLRIGTCWVLVVLTLSFYPLYRPLYELVPLAVGDYTLLIHGSCSNSLAWFRLGLFHDAFSVEKLSLWSEGLRDETLIFTSLLPRLDPVWDPNTFIFKWCRSPISKEVAEGLSNWHIHQIVNTRFAECKIIYANPYDALFLSKIKNI